MFIVQLLAFMVAVLTEAISQQGLWRVQFTEVERLLRASGFWLAEVLERRELEGMCLFRRIT
jgi:hypothetical protein